MRNRPADSSIKQAEGGPHLLRLDVSKAAAAAAPIFFRCPISLEVMRSPVSLCTGVTYDRSSIQKWLDCGNTTCPATMLPLSSTDLVPNLTLRRLIHLWSPSSSEDIPSLSYLSGVLSDPHVDDVYKLHVLSSDSLHPSALASLFLADDTLELAATLFSHLFSLHLVDAERKRGLVAALSSHFDAAVSGLIAVLKCTSHSSSRAAAAMVLETLIAERRVMIVEKPELMTELMKLIGESNAEAVDAGLRCLMGLTGVDLSISSSASPLGRRVREEIVKRGAVTALTKVMMRNVTEIPAAVAEKAMRVMKAAAACVEGRAAIYAEAERCVEALVGRIMNVGNEGREAAVAVLWRVCCAGGGDRRAREALASAKGAMAKILVVMQGGCSPSARMMAGDLLRIFPANAKSSIAAAGYHSKTIHIMPF